MKHIFSCFLFMLIAVIIPPRVIAQNVLDLAGLNETAITTVAYSVRKLSSTYTGKCMQVRRSDNTTQDIGFTAGGELDITALQAFANGGDAFVVTWYDQSGNNRNLTQATPANQPRIVNAGNTDLENNKPFIRFFGIVNKDNDDQSLKLATEIRTTGHLAVVNKFTAGGDGFLLGHSGSYYWHTNPGTNQLVDFVNASASYKNGKFWQNGSSVTPSEAIFNTSLMVHSIVPADASIETTWNNIGKDRSYHHTSGGGGYAELIVFSEELNIYSRNNLIENQGTYFGISVTPVAYLNKYGKLVTSTSEIVNRNGGLGSSGIFSNGKSISRAALASAPITAPVTLITSYSATSGGTISSDKGANLKAGVCWNTSPNPTTQNAKTMDIGKFGTYTSLMTGLRGSTTYYVRSYASNYLGTKYGTEYSFTTSASVLPIFTGNSKVSEVKATSAIIESNLFADGGEPITAKGFCWSTASNPTISNSKTSSADLSTGAFSAKLSNLSLSTTYYVRAYATNSLGTAYGDEVSFTTSATLSVGDNYQGGIIGYILNNTDPGYVAGETHGLIVAENDASASRVQWSNYLNSSLGTNTAFGSGKNNTRLINAFTGASTNWAAYLCSSQNLGGYTDWYLPSKEELNRLYLNKNLLPNFKAFDYWTSSQDPNSSMRVWVQNFGNGSQQTNYTFSSYYVRPVRSF